MTHQLTTLLTVGVLASSATGQAWFAAPRQILQSDTQDIRALADVDGNGTMDLIVVEANSAIERITSFTPYLNTGGGNFVPGATVSTFGGLEADAFFLVGDVTGDRLPDVLTSLREYSGTPGHGFLMYLNLGSSTFAAPLHTPIPAVTNNGALSDWDGNGTQEVVITHLRQDLSDGTQRWTWNGAGFMASNEVWSVEEMENVCFGEVTGDSLRDVIVGGDFYETVQVIPTLPGGSLGTPVPYVVGTPSIIDGRVVSCGDLDNDGDDDIFVAWKHDPSGFKVAVIENQGGVLQVGLEKVFNIDPGFYNSGENELVDWDGDGDLDAILSWELMVFLENRGASGFFYAGAIPMSHGQQGSFGIDGAWGAGTHDFDGNGHPDYVAGDVIKYGNGTFENAWDFFTPGTVLRPSDVDMDGDLDVVHAGGEILENDGTGAFANLGQAFPQLPATFFYRQAQAWGDFTGNGFDDFLVDKYQNISLFQNIFLGMHVLEGRADGRFIDIGLATQAPVGIGSFFNFTFAQVDLDGDTDIDLAEAGGWWANTGSGFFNFPFAAWSGEPIDAGDVDGVFGNDVLTYELNGAVTTIELWRNQGGGSFVSEILATESEPPTNISRLARLVDLDGDGDLDFAAGSGSAPGPGVLMRENVNGVFGPIQVLPGVDRAHEMLAFDDVDNDGRLDVIGAPNAQTSVRGGTWLVWRRNGPGLNYAAPVAFFARPMSSAGDIDGDGDVDLWGRTTMRGWRFNGPGAGVIRQYGVGQPGPSGIAPIMGVRGPVRAGSFAELRLRRGQGGGVAFLVLGLGEGNLPGIPAPGLTLYVSPFSSVTTLPLLGTTGVPGEGYLHLTIPVSIALTGLDVFHQIYTIDGFGVGGSNGLEILYGG